MSNTEEPRICACGCGREVHGKPHKKFATDTCRSRAHNKTDHSVRNHKNLVEKCMMALLQNPALIDAPDIIDRAIKHAEDFNRKFQ